MLSGSLVSSSSFSDTTLPPGRPLTPGLCLGETYCDLLTDLLYMFECVIVDLLWTSNGGFEALRPLRFCYLLTPSSRTPESL